MNGKIKTKFAALFAVALMITVCVVPVVGNEGVQAVVTDPSDAVSLTVSGNVYNSTGSKITNVELQITAGSETYKVYDADGSYSQTIYVPKDTIVSNITVTLNATSQKITNAAGEEVANGAYGLWTSNPSISYQNVDMKGISTKTISNVNFKAGYTTISGILYYANGAGSFGVYKTSTTVMLYEKDIPSGAAAVYVGTNYYSNSVDGNFVIYVPANLTPSKATSTFVVGANMPGISYADAAVGASGIGLKSTTQYVFTLSFDNKVADTITFGVPEDSKVILNNTSLSVTKDDTSKDVVYTLSDDTALTTNTINVNGTYGKVASNPVAIGSTTPISYTQTNVVSGTVKMSTVDALEGNVVLSLLKSDDTLINSYTSNVVDGKYEIWYPNGLTDVAKLGLKYSIGNFVAEYGPEPWQTYGTQVYNQNLTVNGANYVKISGKIFDESGATGVGNASISIAGMNIFGLKNGSVMTKVDGSYSVMVPEGQIVTIAPESTYSYDVASIQVQASSELSNLNFKMDDKKVEIKFVDYDAEVLSGVSVYYATYIESSKLWTTTDSNIDSDSEGVATLTFPGNVDLSKIYVVFDKDGRTFANDKDSTPLSPIAIGSITADVKVLDTYNAVEIVDANGEPLTTAGTLSVYKYNVSIENNVTVYEKIGSAYSTLTYSDGLYYFIGVMESQSVSATGSEVLAVEISETNFPDYIFNKVYVLSDVGSVTKIVAYSDSISGTVYEADKESIIKTMGGSTVSLYIDGNLQNSAVATGYVKKDGTFTVNTYSKLTSDSVIVIENSGEYTFEPQNVLIDNKDVTSYYANEMTFTVTFVDVDGKSIKSTATVNGKSVVNGKVILEPSIGDALNVAIQDRTFTGYEITEEMITSKKIDFVSNQATYTVYVTDSNGNAWENGSVGFNIWTTSEYEDENVGDAFSSSAFADGKIVKVLTVPENKEYAVMIGAGAYAKYFSNELYAFEDYEVTVPAIGNFVKVTATEANGSIVKTSILSAVAVYEKDTDVAALYVNANANVVEYFAVDGKEYEFDVTGVAPYSFGYDAVNSGRIYAVDGLLLANEETISGKVICANGYNMIPSSEIYVALESGESHVATTDTYGMYSAVVDVDKVVSYIVKDSNNEIIGESDTPDVVLKLSMFGGKAPVDDNTGVIAALYKGEDIVEIEDAVVLDGTYMFYMDVSKGDKVVLSFEVGGKTFQQAIDLKVVQNDIIVPGSLVLNTTPDLFTGYYVIYGADTAVIGSEIILSAKKTVSVPMDEYNVAYTTLVFSGWYVNGEKISEDVNATYTVDGPCEVYAYYTESVTETGADNSNDLSMDVLVLGIVIVILALLAFVYAVKFKKE